MPPPLDGTFAGTARFRPLALLGRGTLGLVYRAYDQETGQEVALKTLARPAAENIFRLKEEFRSLASVVHPNLIELYELQVDADHCFFTMELLDGADFVEHVRARRGAPEVLTAVLTQLVRGVTALHGAGKLHRDIKPSNVMVTRAGRVVLLDFGLAAPLGHDSAREFGGTLAYAAPEQLEHGSASAASDWYSVGVMLYEALAGHTPFAGASFEQTLARKRGGPPALDALGRETRRELVALLRALLEPDPARRPTPPEISALLGDPRLAAGASPADAPLVGRQDELDRLRAIVQSGAGGPQLVQVTGPSGIGKSAFVRRFVDDARAGLELLAFTGRCHPLEAVPYKAFDQVIDALSRHLVSLPGYQAESLPPQSVAALLRLFPVLRRVPALRARAAQLRAMEPRELRRLGFAALRALFASLGARRLVLWIDDLQWGDVDSLLLIRELVAAPDPLPLTLVCSYRSEDRAQGRVLRSLEQLAAELPAGRRHAVELGPLPAGDARRLVARLLDPARDDYDACLAAIVHQAGGSPFLADALGRHFAGGARLVDVGALDTSRVVHDRVDALDDEERAILELVAVAGRPLARAVALRAAGFGERARPGVARLSRRLLVRATELDGQPAVETYHDRIREAVVEQLGDPARRRRHRQLADALRAEPEQNAQALVEHYLGAGDRVEAALFALPAADHAAQALAFDRAAELYALARELNTPGIERWQLEQRRADALANAGRGGEAAAGFRDAAALLRGASGDDARAPALERRAAELFLRWGRLDDGTRLVAGVLGRVGVALPGSPERATLAMLAQRARLLVRGLDFRVRPAAEIPPRALERLDALWTASTSLSMIDHSAADALGVQHLIGALDAGEPSRLTRALGYEAAFEALVAGRWLGARIRRLLDTMSRLARSTGDPYDQAWAVMSEGITAYFFADWRRTARLCDQARELYLANCRGTAWEIAITDAYSLAALAQRGAIHELSRRLPEALQLAEHRGDPFAHTCRLGPPSVTWLAEDRADFALAQAAAAIESWPRSSAYQSQHYNHLLATAQAEIYRGDVESAWARLEADWPRLGRARLLRAQWLGEELRHLRARAALALAERSPGAARARLVAIARAEADRIAAGKLPPCAPLAASLRAGAARLDKNFAAASAQLRAAIDGFAAADMALHREAARMCAGLLEGGDGGAARWESGRRAMREAGVVNPTSFAAVLVPGFSVSESHREGRSSTAPRPIP